MLPVLPKLSIVLLCVAMQKYCVAHIAIEKYCVAHVVIAKSGFAIYISVRCHLSAILLSPKNNSPHGRTSTTVLPLIDRDKCPLQLGEGPVRIAHIVRDRELSRIFVVNIDYRPRVPSVGRP